MKKISKRYFSELSFTNEANKYRIIIYKMEEQPIFDKKMIYLGLFLDVYKFRDNYLIIVKQELNNKPEIMGATIATKENFDALTNEVAQFSEEEQNNTSYPFPVSEFLGEMGHRSGSHVLFVTYRYFLERRRDNTTSENNRAIFNRLLQADEFADRYMLTVVSGPLKNCVFDAEGFDYNKNTPLFLGDKIMTVLGNIMDKVYLKYVTIGDDISRMRFDQKDERLMTIATALLLPQEGREQVLPNDLMRRITNEYGGKKKRKTLKKKRKTKRRKSLKKKRRKTKRKGRK